MVPVESLSSSAAQRPVQRRTRHTELTSDGRNVLTRRDTPTDNLYRGSIHLPWTTVTSIDTVCLRNGDAFTLALTDQTTLELSERAHHLKLKLGHRRRSLVAEHEVFFDELYRDATPIQLLDKPEKITKVTSQPIERMNHEHVTIPQVVKRSLQRGPVCILADCLSVNVSSSATLSNCRAVLWSTVETLMYPTRCPFFLGFVIPALSSCNDTILDVSETDVKEITNHPFVTRKSLIPCDPLMQPRMQ